MTRSASLRMCVADFRSLAAPAASHSRHRVSASSLAMAADTGVCCIRVAYTWAQDCAVRYGTRGTAGLDAVPQRLLDSDCAQAHRQLPMQVKGSGKSYMWFTIGALIVLVAVAIVPRLRVAGRADADLGWMSDQWLTEQRASRRQ
jgi:hypothetical protein